MFYDRSGSQRNVISEYHLDSLSKNSRNKKKILHVILAFTIFDKYDGCRIDKSFGINCVRKRLMRMKDRAGQNAESGKGDNTAPFYIKVTYLRTDCVCEYMYMYIFTLYFS